MKYLAQATLIDGDIETVIDSIKTDDHRTTVEWLMKRHCSSYSYRYTVLDLETNEVLINTTRNIYGR